MKGYWLKAMLLGRQRGVLQMLLGMAIVAWSLPIDAHEISADDAIRAAEAWLQENPSPMGCNFPSTEASEVKTFSDENGRAIYHLLAFPGGGGVVLSADDGINPVVSFMADLQLEGWEEGPLHSILIADMKGRLAGVDTVRDGGSVGSVGNAKKGARNTTGKSVVEAHEKAWARLLAPNEGKRSKAGMTVRAAVPSDMRRAPMLKTQWNQGAPYNWKVPDNMWLGCTAVAFGQVMNKHQKPSENFLWKLPLWIPGDKPVTSEQKAVGELLYDVAVAAETKFGQGSSSASITTAAAALRNKFRYASAHCLRQEALFRDNLLLDDVKDNLFGHDHWRHALLASLDSNLPCVISLGGDGDHAAVADGYGFSSDEVLYCHVNMGWGGDYDNWYDLMGEPIVTKSNKIDPESGKIKPDIVIISYKSIKELCYNIDPSDANWRLTGRVLDKDGKPLEGAKVELKALPSKKKTKATTDKYGIYSVGFPNGTTSVELTAKKGKLKDKETVEVKDANLWGLNFYLGRQDIVLCIDSTSSMSGAIASCKVAAAEIVRKSLGGATSAVRAVSKAVGVAKSDTDEGALGGGGNRVAVVEYRDKGDAFAYRSRADFTTNAVTAIAAINGISVAGGGDTEEAVYATLRAIVNGLAGTWQAFDRHIIVMTDAPPHDPDRVSGDTLASIEKLLAGAGIERAAKGIVIVRDADANEAGEEDGALGDEEEDGESEEDGDEEEEEVTPVYHVHIVYLGRNSSAISAYQALTEATGGTLQSSVDPSEAADAIIEALDVIVEGGTKTAEAEIGWKFLKATGTYFAQLRVAFPDGGWEDTAGLRYLFADRIGADGKTAAGLWSSQNRAALAATEVYGGETYRAVTLDSTALAAGGGEAVYGVQNLGADGIPVAERGIEMYVRKRVSPDGGNESVAGVEDFVGYVAWEAGGESHAVPVAAGVAPEELSALRRVAVGARGLSVPIAASTLNRSLAVGVALDDGAEPYCTVASYQTESGRMYGTVEVGATKDGRMRRGALGANATVTLLGAKTAIGPYEELGAADVGQDGTFEMDVPEGAAFFRFRIDVADTVK